MNFKGKGAYFMYVTAFEMRFDVAKIMIIFQMSFLKQQYSCQPYLSVLYMNVLH